MHPFEFALAIVAIVLIFKLIRLAIVHKTATRRDGNLETVNSELGQRIFHVEESVRVLERLVTDVRFDLMQQFMFLGA